MVVGPGGRRRHAVRLAAILLVAALAGCSQDREPDPTTTSTTTTPADPGPSNGTTTQPTPFPEDLHKEVAFTAGMDVIERYTFTLPRPATVAATLAWSLAVNDLDLWLLREGGDVAMSATSFTQSEALAVEVAGGNYEVEVRTPIVAVADQFVLDVHFTEPAEA